MNFNNIIITLKDNNWYIIANKNFWEKIDK